MGGVRERVYDLKNGYLEAEFLLPKGQGFSIKTFS